MSKMDQGPTPKESLEEAMATAWEELSSHYSEIRAMQGFLWNRVNSMDVLNSFLGIHGKLTSRFHSEYAQLEKTRVQEAMVRYQNSQPQLAGEIPADLAGFPEQQKQAICWKHTLASYCDIHGRLKVDLRTWNQDDFRQFESTISDLIQNTINVKVSSMK